MNLSWRRGGLRLLPLLCIFNLYSLLVPVGSHAQLSFPGINYCSVPPFPGAGVKPNVLLMLDNSAKMWDLAYTNATTKECSASMTPCSSDADCYPTADNGSCVSVPPYYCYDDTYDDTKSYDGYFGRNSYYSYDSAAERFVLASSLPTCNGAGSCLASTGYFYLKRNGQGLDFSARGNFLNWLSASRLDIEKQVLTGGKFQQDSGSTGGVLVGETRGCQGKKFLKAVPEAPQVTFAVFGGTIPSVSLPESALSTSTTTTASASWLTRFEYRPSIGGATVIEVFDQQYDKKDCTAIVRAWQNHSVNAATLTAAKSCLRNCEADTFDPNAGTVRPVITEDGMFATAMADCIPNEKVDLRKECMEYIAFRAGGDFKTIQRKSGAAVCGYFYHTPYPPGSPPFTAEKVGFVGASIQNGGIPSTSELTHYCADLTRLWVINPVVDLPTPLLDMGVHNVSQGNKPAGLFKARVSVGSAPTGVIQQVAADINLGAMVFNENGAGPTDCKKQDRASKNGGISFGEVGCVKHCKSGAVDSGRECFVDLDCKDLSGYTCQDYSSTFDGGKVIASVGPLPGVTLADHINNLVAATNAVTATSWSPLAETFYNAMWYLAGRTDLRLQDGDFQPEPRSSCQLNNVVIVSDGISSADRSGKLSKCLEGGCANITAGMPSSMMTKSTAVDKDPPLFRGSYNLDDLAWIARHKNLSSSDFSKEIAYNKDFITTYVVYTGEPCAARNSDGSCITTDEGVAEKLMQLTAAQGGGTIVTARTRDDLESDLRSTFQSIVAVQGVAGGSGGSGTDPSVISSGEGNGAILLREQFFPSKSFDGWETSASWVGEMQNLWYYIDPFIGSAAGAGSTIREDTDQNSKLTLREDKVASLRYDTDSNRTLAYLTVDSNADGSGEGDETKVQIDQLKTLWRAGELLWERDLSLSPRTIYTPLLTGGTEIGGTGLMGFAKSSSAPLTPYLDLQSGDPSAATLVDFIHGFQTAGSGLRSRRVTIGNRSGDASKGVGVWKLGDVIGSTPQVQSQVPLGGYHLSSPNGYGDLSYASFIGSKEYGGRGTVYLGANDGMLHAFNFGTLDATANGEQKAALSGSEIGKEQWGFIPKNALPYLKYLAAVDYPHLYYVDGKSTLVDASIGDINNGTCTRATYWNCLKPDNVTMEVDSSDPAFNTLDPNKNTWRSVLIGAMGLGGASCSSGGDCVSTPIADPYDDKKRVGYSSYFALDVTDPNTPSLLWEFSNPLLGYSTTGPAIVRIGPPRTNGRWFAVFGSGPTGPIDTRSHQFQGRSGQELQFFVVDLRTGDLLTTIHSGIGNAFAGAMSGAGIDVDRWSVSYQDDALYVGYSQYQDNGSWGGGIVRIVTNENLDPAKWQLSRVTDRIGPVTGGVAKIQDRKNNNLWLYFGSGRYFFLQDDMGGGRSLYGIKEPCYNIKENGVVVKKDKLDAACTTTVDSLTLVDQTTTVHAVGASDPGWKIDLYGAQAPSGAERLLITPTSTRSGAVLFATFQPNADPCSFGDSYLWGVSYDSGGPLPAASLRGKALVQLASGGMQESDLSKAFVNRLNRSSDKMTGLPGGVRLVSNSGLRPLKKIIQIQER